MKKKNHSRKALILVGVLGLAGVAWGALAPSSPVTAQYTQPATTNGVRRNIVTILGDGATQVTVDRLDSAGNVIEEDRLTVPQAGGNVTDEQGRVYGSVSDGTFTSAVATVCNQVDAAVAAYAAANKFVR